MTKLKQKQLDSDQWFIQLGWDLLEDEWRRLWSRKWENGHVLL